MIGFSGEKVDTKGYVNLLTIFGDENRSKTITVKYLLVNVLTSYNILMGRLAINELGAIIATFQVAMKFPNYEGKMLKIEVSISF